MTITGTVEAVNLAFVRVRCPGAPHYLEVVYLNPSRAVGVAVGDVVTLGRAPFTDWASRDEWEVIAQ